MDKKYFSLRRYLKRRRYKVKRIHKEWVGFGTGLRAVLADLFIVFQLGILVALYAFIVYRFRIVFYVCLGLNALAMLYVAVFEKDVQSKISWILLFAVSFGCGFIAYILAITPVSYGRKRRRFKKIAARVQSPASDFPITAGEAEGEAAVAADTGITAEYLVSNGFKAYCGTEGKYFADSRSALYNLISRIETAERFVFIEFFIVADGILLEKLLGVFRRKVAEGVEIYMLYDDVGSAGVFSGFMKKAILAAGVKLKAFSKLFSPFYFGLNFRDHRKTVVVDGKTGYVGGYNLIDDCANQRKMEGRWKDSGMRLDGAAVDGLSVAFIRQWELATHEKLDPAKYLGNYADGAGGARYIPYAGGPEIKQRICRGVYSRMIDGAKERLFIMTPYLVPDSGITKQLIKKAEEGVDVRLVLPGVPDYRYIYRVTVSNARRLIKRGIKVYYAAGEFVHGKVMLTENEAAVGSVNLDMRAFYQEFDNGVLTDDKAVLSEINDDFKWVFACNLPEKPAKSNPVSAVLALIMRIVSPLM